MALGISGSKDSRLPDISEWYTSERIEAEEILWEGCEAYKEYSQRIFRICRENGLSTVLEVGCGTGWVPTVLDPSLDYTGVDKNACMISKAKTKNPGKRFIQSDIRKLRESPVSLRSDLVCSFAMLKHFSLDEWPSILIELLFFGKFGLFDQHVLLDGRSSIDVPGEDLKTGEKFHGIWPTRSEIVSAVENAGHEILDFDDTFRFDNGVGAPEAMITTRRKENHEAVPWQ